MLPQDLLAATEVMIVTCESNPVEVEGLRARCATCQRVDAARRGTLGRLALGQAVALPIHRGSVRARYDLTDDELGG